MRNLIRHAQWRQILKLRRSGDPVLMSEAMCLFRKHIKGREDARKLKQLLKGTSLDQTHLR